MGILDLDKVEGREIRKCISEMTDFIYEKSEGFKDWYNELDDKEEKLLDDGLFNILNRRLNKHKFGK